MHPVKPICDKRPRKNGLHPICIQYCYNSKRRTLLNTGIDIPYHSWNYRSAKIQELPPGMGDALTLNNKIQTQIRVVEDLISMALQNKLHPLVFVRENFHPALTTDNLVKQNLNAKQRAASFGKDISHHDIYFQIEDYIRSKMRKVSPDMLRNYRNMKHHLQAFEARTGKTLTFDSLDLTFYESFVDFLSYDYTLRRKTEETTGLRVNTIGKTIKELRTFLRDRIRKRIIAPIDMEGWKILEEEIDSVYLSWPEIERIRLLDLSAQPELVPYRNDFIVGCLTGLRFSDLSELTVQDIRGDLLYKKQKKSNHSVVIPLRPEAKAMLLERFAKKVPVLTNVLFNLHIKTIAQLAGIVEEVKYSYKKGNQLITEVKPKYALVCTHTCRRSFCTNEFLDGTPVELIMKISGHKSVKDFYKYIRISPEEAGRKIQVLWQQRGQMAG